MRFFLIFLILGLLVYAHDLRSAWAVNAGILHPHFYSPNQMYAQVLVYEGLVRFGKDGVIEPSIASSWEVSDDGKVYTFTLPKGMKFSDGSELDAKAVEQNFSMIMENKKHHWWLGLVQVIESFEAVDSQHFVLRLKSPYSATLKELSLPRPFRILAPSGFGDYMSISPIGSGPWKLEKSVLGVHDIFIPNPYYRGKKPEFERFIVKVIPDPHARLLALESGAIDILIGREMLSVENFVRLSKNPKFRTQISRPQGTNLLVLNSASINSNMRKAIALAFNKEMVLKNILLNVEPQADTLFSKEVAAFSANLKPLGFVPQEAHNLIEQETQRVFTLTYLGSNPTQKAIAEALQGDLAKVGITLELKAKEQTSFYQAQKNGDFDIIFNETWGDPFDPHAFLGSMLAPSHADYAAQSLLENKQEIDLAIREILHSNDEEVLASKYAFVLQALHDSGVYLPISRMPVFAVFYDERLQNFSFGEMRSEFMFHLLQPKMDSLR
ncbi:MAG: nickel ABC transporter substrate-binding protein [Helicobacter sp.]|nr:nickel ABC transporter substrate-binding protein [Helicobacter sp.]